MPFSPQMLKRAVIILIAFNILMFFVDQQVRGGLVNSLALHFPKNENYEVWQYISHMFMHGSIMHLGFNMYALWMFGSALESVLGRVRFLIFYFVCGIGAALIYNGVNYYQFNQVYSLLADSGLNNADIMQMISKYSYPPSLINEAQAGKMFGVFYSPMVGASGAIYGILVAFALYFPNNKLMLIFIPYPIPAKVFVPVLIAIDLFSGVTGFSLFGGGVAHFAHVGGAIIGFLLLLIWRKEFTKKAVIQ
ncbi:MAG: membrane associated rhomboid family serine protease [Cocleimonas sp.]|jgi:membrane associated rhomboid family serine protease